MPKISNKNNRNRLRIIVLTFIGIVAFVVSVFMNIVGMSNAINHAPDSSGMAGISVRKKNTSLAKKEEKKVDKDGKIIEEDILVNALPIISLNNNNWDRMQAKLSGFQLDESGNAVFEEGYTLYCNQKYVNCIVFNNTFEKEVVGHLKVGTDFKTIEDNLGVPTFRKKDSLGYKTKEVYVFFYENEIAVYPNRNISNNSLEELINSYEQKSYEKGRTYFLVDIRNNYNDFVITQDTETDTIIITSTTRQMIAKLDGIGNIEVELYNGYNVATYTTNDYIEKNIYTKNDKDLVEIVENERVSGR